NHLFLEIFVRDILKLKTDDFDLSNCEVIPKEIDKKEFEYIDILIVNKARKQAIIIENKIGAGDSNHRKNELLKNSKSTYNWDGQLERYYSTLKTGKNKNEGDIKPYLKCNTVFVFYLKDNCKEEDIKESLGILLKEEHRNSWKGIIS